MELTNKTALVTGASGGLGGEIAVGLARAGCDVIVHYNTNLQGAERTALMVRQAGRKAETVQLDLLAEKHWGGLFENRDGFGPLKVLVNSAAIFGRTPVGSIDAKQAARMSAMDMLVPILLCQEFARFVNKPVTGYGLQVTGEDQERDQASVQHSADSGQEEIRGKIVNIADVGGERPWKGYSVYCAAKAGLISATKSLAKELAPRITVNAVAPGLVTWPEGMDEAGRKRQLGFIPAGRIAQPQEIAATVVFLLQNDYITGQVLNVDGGRAL